MAKFPIQYTEQTVSGRGPSVRGDVDVRTGEEKVGQTIGRGILFFADKYYTTQAQTQLSEFQRKANEEINRLAISYDTNLDPETYRAEYEKSIEKIRSLMPKNAKAVRGAQLWLETKEPAWLRDVDKARLNRADDNWLAELFEKQSLVEQTGQIGTFPAFIAEGVQAGRIDKSDAAKELAKTHKMAVVGQITNLYRAGSYKEARTLTESSALRITDKESLLKTIDLVEKHNKRKVMDLNYEKDMQVNENFVSKIITKDLLPDEVKGSRLADKPPKGIFSVDKLSKQEWMQYVRSSFDDPPQKTTSKGFRAASGAVLDYAKFQIPKETAYRRLLDSRYIHKEITDEDFAWSINHINKPYSRHIVADIETVLQSNRDAIARGGFLWGLITSDAEEEKARSVNSELISWIDNEIAQDREPTREQMYNKSAQLRAQSETTETRIATPKTQADYDKLPPGTTYIDPETGKLFRKQ